MFPDRFQISVGIVHAVFQLPQCAIVVVQANRIADLNSDVGSRNVFGKRIGFGDCQLPLADGIHAGAKIHAPNCFGAEFADVEFQLRGVEITAPFCDEVLQILSVIGHIIFLEHVVFAQMPHKPFNSILDALLIQFSQRGFNQIKCQRLHLEAGRIVRIPITPQVGAAGRALNDRDWMFDVFDKDGGGTISSDEIRDLIK